MSSVHSYGRTPLRVGSHLCRSSLSSPSPQSSSLSWFWYPTATAKAASRRRRRHRPRCCVVWKPSGSSPLPRLETSSSCTSMRLGCRRFSTIAARFRPVFNPRLAASRADEMDNPAASRRHAAAAAARVVFCRSTSSVVGLPSISPSGRPTGRRVSVRSALAYIRSLIGIGLRSSVRCGGSFSLLLPKASAAAAVAAAWRDYHSPLGAAVSARRR